MSMESIRIENMYDLKETIAAEIFEGRRIRGKCFRSSKSLL